MGIAVAREGEIIDGKTELPSRPAVVEAGETERGTVAVLGCGPAGLLAAHAVALAGHEPFIISARKEPSEIPGAVYLHKPIPDITGADPDAVIRFVKVGTREGYARKVYGDESEPCSWDRFPEGNRPMWSLGLAYERLWGRYSDQIVEQTVNHESAQMLVDTFALVVSTIPAHALCYQGHHFHSQTVWFRDVAVMDAGISDPVIIYDGRPSTPYYRTSLIDGHGSTEYGQLPNLPRPNTLVSGTKPRGTDCDCFPEIVRAGRFGTWTPGVLAHHAFETVWERMFEGLEQ